MKSLDIITVTKNDVQNLAATYKSILDFGVCSKREIQWIIVDGGQDLKNSILMQEILKNFRIKVNYTNMECGIYTGMNFGLTKVESDFFILLNSGDMLLLEFDDYIDDIDQTYVTCFNSKWHNSELREIENPNARGFQPKLARMPNHQAMVFPREFSKWIYEESFTISADQDMKLRLYTENKLKHRNDFIVCSLVGGISMRKLSTKEIKFRSFESRQIFSRHFNQPRATFLWLLYSFNYILRIRLRRGDQTYRKDWQ